MLCGGELERSHVNINQEPFEQRAGASFAHKIHTLRLSPTKPRHISASRYTPYLIRSLANPVHHGRLNLVHQRGRFAQKPVQGGKILHRLVLRRRPFHQIVRPLIVDDDVLVRHHDQEGARHPSELVLDTVRQFHARRRRTDHNLPGPSSPRGVLVAFLPLGRVAVLLLGVGARGRYDLPIGRDEGQRPEGPAGRGSDREAEHRREQDDPGHRRRRRGSPVAADSVHSPRHREGDGPPHARPQQEQLRGTCVAAVVVSPLVEMANPRVLRHGRAILDQFLRGREQSVDSLGFAVAGQIRGEDRVSLGRQALGGVSDGGIQTAGAEAVVDHHDGAGAVFGVGVGFATRRPRVEAEILGTDGYGSGGGRGRGCRRHGGGVCDSIGGGTKRTMVMNQWIDYGLTIDG
mmetsp:Transcript_20434/g.59166  ORF Transcript_20434/g.59166 Transcript_20434/m.59166 type:complete len:404 (+) Transcript_20434:420-1631(+)